MSELVAASSKGVYVSLKSLLQEMVQEEMVTVNLERNQANHKSKRDAKAQES